MRIFVAHLLWLFMLAEGWAQPNPDKELEPTSFSNITGEVVDKNTLRSIFNVEVSLLNFFPPRAVAAEEGTGRFLLSDVPVGRYRVLISAPNYQDLVVENVLVSVGKEFFIQAQLEEAPKEIRLPPRRTPRHEQYLRALPVASHNVLSYLGSVDYTLDEVNRFSGARNDPSRLMAGASGAINSDDQRNDIISFGANPLGMQYRLEGIPIINPNHLGLLGSPAGFLPVINTNSLGNSAFLQGNFSAEYGNSTAGVFDMNLRAGNKDKRELMAGFSFNGLELMAEGALNKSKTASYLVNGRYGIFGLLGKIPFAHLGTDALPKTQDINFKLVFEPSRKQKFSFFGYFGHAAVRTPLGKLLIANGRRNYSTSANSYRGAFGLKHLLFVSGRSYLQTAIGSSQAYSDATYTVYPEYYQNPQSTRAYLERDFACYLSNYYFSTLINTKFSRFYTQKIGASLDLQHTYLDEYFQFDSLPRLQTYNTLKNAWVANVYYQMQYRPTFKLSIQAGWNLLYYSLNRKFAFEPRLSVNYDFNIWNRLSFGYCLQHQQISQRVQFHRSGRLDETQAGGYAYDQSAQNLPLWGNHYGLLEYTFRINEFWQVKTSALGRYWFNVPIHADSSSSYSLYNSYSNLSEQLPKGKLAGAGEALNYGGDISLKKNFHKGFYMELSGAWFRVKYSASDKKWYNATFDRRFISRLRVGHEFKIGRNKNHLCFLSTTITWAGGKLLPRLMCRLLSHKGKLFGNKPISIRNARLIIFGGILKQGFSLTPNAKPAIIFI